MPLKDDEVEMILKVCLEIIKKVLFRNHKLISYAA